MVASCATMHVLDFNQSLDSFQKTRNVGTASNKCEGAVVHSTTDGILAVSTGAEGIHRATASVCIMEPPCHPGILH